VQTLEKADGGERMEKVDRCGLARLAEQPSPVKLTSLLCKSLVRGVAHSKTG
jgi:hypothetical protein